VENEQAGRAVRVVGHEPCFEVADVRRAVGHYQLLGFAISYHDEHYAFAHRDNLTIHLAYSEQPTTGAVRSTSTSTTPTGSQRTGARPA
jgi:hypothetical protein